MNKKNGIIVLSVIGLLLCISLLMPSVRQLLIEQLEHFAQRKTSLHEEWMRTLLAYAIGGICLILLFDYCALTTSGKKWVSSIKCEIVECLSNINFHAFIKPVVFLFCIYLLGILTIIRADFLYLDDVGRTAAGYRGWYDWSRYISEFFSIIIHADFRLTDISPLPQLLAISILSVAGVLFVYVLCNGKLTLLRLLATIPIGLSPYFLECLSYKYDSPHMALSVLASIVPFLFITRKKAFIFCSVVSLLCMLTTYQAASGIYIMLVLMLSFQYWNRKQKTNKEIFQWMGQALIAYGIAMFIFRFFLMKPHSTYVSNEIHTYHQLIPGIIENLKTYIVLIYNDFSSIWLVLILLITLFFIIKSIQKTSRNKIITFIVSLFLILFLFIATYGFYSVLAKPLFSPRALYGLGVFIAILSVCTVTDFRKISAIIVGALLWCFFVFAFSYGNALADQKRYANFRTGILLHDLSNLYPDWDERDMKIQLKNTIGFAPTIQNIAKNNPVIKRLVPYMLVEDEPWANFYYLVYNNFGAFKSANLPLNVKNGEQYVDFNTEDLPVVLESYYHTIKSNGKHVLVILKE